MQQSDHADCKLLVHSSLISLDILFKKETCQAIQDDDLYASILYERENGDQAELHKNKKNTELKRVYYAFIWKNRVMRLSTGVL